jgi:hypothetical protein
VPKLWGDGDAGEGITALLTPVPQRLLAKLTNVWSERTTWHEALLSDRWPTPPKRTIRALRPADSLARIHGYSEHKQAQPCGHRTCFAAPRPGLLPSGLPSLSGVPVVLLNNPTLKSDLLQTTS